MKRFLIVDLSDGMSKSVGTSSRWTLVEVLLKVNFNFKYEETSFKRFFKFYQVERKALNSSGDHIPLERPI